jgi:hypothetical protein
MSERFGKRSLLERAGAILLVTAIAGTHVRGAFAQTDEERAGARAAAMEGAQAFKDKKWAEAADLFSRAESLVHAPPHLLFMARAHVNLGKLVKAQEEYRKITREKLDAGAPKPFHDAQAEATKELKDLEPRVPAVKTVVVGGDGKTVTVTVDGAPVPAALIGVQRPIDPGDHKFQAMAEGMVSEVVPLKIREGAKESVTLTLKPGTPPVVAAAPGGTEPAGPGAAPGAPGAPTGGPGASPPPGAETTTVSASSSGAGMRMGSFVAFGVGGIGLGLAAVFAAQASSKHKDADARNTELCGERKPCTAANQAEITELDKKANDAKSLANVGLIVGGVGLAAGVTLLVLSMGGSNDGAAPKTGSITPYVGPSSLGLSGTF